MLPTVQTALLRPAVVPGPAGLAPAPPGLQVKAASLSAAAVRQAQPGALVQVGAGLALPALAAHARALHTEAVA